MATKTEKVHVAEVVKAGSKLVLPDGWDAKQAIEFLHKLQEAEESQVQVVGKWSVFPLEGAYALERAMEKVFGMTIQVGTPGMFSDTPPLRLTVKVSPTEEVSVPWGRIKLPIKDKGYVDCGTEMTDRGLIFVAMFTVLGKWKTQAEQAVKMVQTMLNENMLLKGRTFSVRFRGDDGEYLRPFAEVTPFKTVATRPIFSETVDNAIDAYVLTPISHQKEIAKSGVPFKRGIIAGGPYGTGKTMLACYVAGFAAQHGVTFIYLPDSREITDGLLLAKQYAPAVVFAEDVDRVAGGAERTDDVNSVINQLDGIDTKNAAIMTILTSNHPERLNKAMIRPGRIDLGLALMPPDGPTAARLVKHYLGDLAQEGTDFQSVGEHLDGRIPAAIREVVERSKLAAISRTGQAVAKGTICPADVITTAKQLQNEELLFSGPPADTRSDLEKAADRLGGHILKASGADDDVFLPDDDIVASVGQVALLGAGSEMGS